MPASLASIEDKGRAKDSTDPTSSVYVLVSSLLVGALIFSSIFLSITFPFEGFLAKLRPVDLILMSMIFVLLVTWNSNRIKATLRKLEGFKWPLTIFAIITILDGILRSQWQFGFVNLWTLLYLFVPITLIGPNPNLITKKIILTALVVTQSVLAVWVLQLVVLDGVRYRTLLGASFIDPNHTASWLLGASLVLALGFGSHWVLIRCVVIIISLISIGFLDSNSTFLAAAVCIPMATFYLVRTSKIDKIGNFILVCVGIAIIPIIVFIPKINWGESAESRSSNVVESGTVAAKESVLIDGWAFRPTQSLGSREALVMEGLRVYSQVPLFGTGLDRALAQQPLAMAGYEFHNELITFLVGYGPAGVFFLITFFITCWRLSSDTGRTVVALIFLIALAHASFSWRHLWIFLSIAIILQGNNTVKVARKSRQRLPFKTRREGCQRRLNFNPFSPK